MAARNVQASAALALATLWLSAPAAAAPTSLTAAPDGLLEASGRLTDADPKLDGKPYDCYVLRVEEDQAIRVIVRSTEFDATVALGAGRDCATEAAEVDDDGAGGTDSRLEVRIGFTEDMFVRVQAYGAESRGAYRIELAREESYRRTAPFGRASAETLTRTDRVGGPRSDVPFDCFDVPTAPGKRLILQATAAEIAPRMLLYGQRGCEGEPIQVAENDGKGGARLDHAPTEYDVLSVAVQGDQTRSRTGAYALFRGGEVASCGFLPGATTFQRFDLIADRAGEVAVRRAGGTVTAQSLGLVFAQDRAWYGADQPLTLAGDAYVKYGLPRVLGDDELVFHTTHDGVRVGREAGGTGRPEAIYVPVGTECAWQPYVRQK